MSKYPISPSEKRIKLAYETYSLLNIIVGFPLTVIIFWFLAFTLEQEFGTRDNIPIIGYIPFVLVLCWFISVPIGLFLGWSVAKLVKNQQLTRNKKDIFKTIYWGMLIYPSPAFLLGILGLVSSNDWVGLRIIFSALLAGALVSCLLAFALPKKLDLESCNTNV
ncbi:hypothetical protein [Alysiella filiformis]|uniref:Uncharacterized protein n=1 Tax=Alysiella filiformis DSM 16848 TaxID=1120981 RepID=A0A286E3D3_9NEIS|nr:hypothetical protein [Alysiella filiformis]QMT31115.1 hypothetical protein H3L97_10410 [Alysiella filiformis]UBQ55893.1 hypothetical protein JF568_10060 [Alysiella filiformis DSM 16848]SOD65379.1 hypothetical protein SAMN02746062_00269 [Alysiella filiformis DSM 16848]